MSERVSWGWVLCAGLLLSYGCGDDGTSTSGTTGDTTGEETTEDPDPSVGPTSVTTTMGATGSTGGTMGETGTTAGETETGVGPSTTESTIEPTTEDPSTTDNTTENPTTTTTGEPTTTDGTSTGDPTTGTTGDEPYCEFVDEKVSCDGDDNDPLKALGFNCDGDDYAVTLTPIVDIQDALDSDSWRVVTGFGLAKDPDDPALPFWGPQEGEKFLVISTGDLRDPFMQTGLLVNGIDDASPGLDNDNPNDVGMLPAPVSPVDGSNNGQGGTPFQDCDGVNDCSDTLEDPWYNDFEMQILNRLWLRFKATPPEQTAGWSMRLVFCSSEYSFVNTPYNDLFIIWQVNEHFTGNVAFIDGDALTVSSLAPYLATDGYTMNHPALDDTGFEGQACTDWLTVRHNVAAGEPLEVAFFIADTFDQIQATVAIFDDFRWRCDACTPGDAQACAVAVPPAGCCGVGLD